MIATVLGLGYCPIASGTVGSLAALPVYYLLHEHPLVQFIVFLVLFFAGVAAAAVIEKETGDKDPSIVVIDEFACLFLAFLFIPFKLVYVIPGFIIYRLIDIIKIPPMNTLEEIPGGWGIMLDDLAGAVYTNLILQAIILIF